MAGTLAVPLTPGDRVRVRLVMLDRPASCDGREAWSLLEAKTAV